jgi:hypothetical protein
MTTGAAEPANNDAPQRLRPATTANASATLEWESQPAAGWEQFREARRRYLSALDRGGGRASPPAGGSADLTPHRGRTTSESDGRACVPRPRAS